MSSYQKATVFRHSKTGQFVTPTSGYVSSSSSNSDNKDDFDVFKRVRKSRQSSIKKVKYVRK